MRSRRTAVLGGSGFIGRYVVKRLAARGDVVPVGCRNAEEAKFLRPMGDVGQVEPLSVVIDNEVVLPAFLAGSGALVNRAGCRGGAVRPYLGDRGGGAFRFRLCPHEGGR
jgi:nucleoside-diphosphate-sugar epimerase